MIFVLLHTFNVSVFPILLGIFYLFQFINPYLTLLLGLTGFNKPEFFSLTQVLYIGVHKYE